MDQYSPEAIYVISDCYGGKAIDSIAGEIEFPYVNRREELAQKCAQELGISPVPDELKEFAVKFSDIPNRGLKDQYSEPNVAPAVAERSLLGMKCVFIQGGLANFIDADGHTYVAPSNKVILEELKNCGYVVMPLEQEIDPNKVAIGYGTETKIVNKSDIREKLTVSLDLLEEMGPIERGPVDLQKYKVLPKIEANLNSMAKYVEVEGTELVKPTISYDVFDPNVVSAYPGYNYVDPEYTYDFLGHSNPIAQKLMAMRSLSIDDEMINDLASLKVKAANNEYLNGIALEKEAASSLSDNNNMSI